MQRVPIWLDPRSAPAPQQLNANLRDCSEGDG